MTTDNTPEINELKQDLLKWAEDNGLLNHFHDCDDSCNDRFMESKMMSELLDLFTAQIEEVERINLKSDMSFVGSSRRNVLYPGDLLRYKKERIKQLSKEQNNE